MFRTGTSISVIIAASPFHLVFLTSHELNIILILRSPKHRFQNLLIRRKPMVFRFPRT